MTLRNPLHYWDNDDQVVRYATQFHDEKGLSDSVELAQFIKGVLYFTNPDADPHTYSSTLSADASGALLSSPSVKRKDLRLTSLEIACIEKHKEPGRLKRWKSLSRGLKLIQTACALAAITQGWDQSAMNAANLGWPATSQLDLPFDFVREPSTRNAMLFGLINGAPFISGSVVGFFFTDPFSNRKFFGRRLVLFIAGLFSFASVIGSAFAKSWSHLLICRLLLGIGMGTKACVVPILLSEVAPMEIRGMMVTTWQMFVSFGIFLGFIANLICYEFDHQNYWKLMLGASSLPAFCMFFIVPFCPESPRWLMRQKRVKDAFDSLLEIHPFHSGMIASGDLLTIYESLHNETEWLIGQAEPSMATSGIRLERMSVGSVESDRGSIVSATHEIRKASTWLRWKIMFKSQRMRSAVYASAAVMFSQQLCGINLFAFLSSNMFFYLVKPELQGTSDKPTSGSALLSVVGLGAGFGAVNLLFSSIAFLCVDWRSSQKNKPAENASRKNASQEHTPEEDTSHKKPKEITRMTLLGVSFPLMALFLLIAGGIMNGSKSPGATYTMLYFFTAAYSIGEGPMAFLISVECFPMVNREIGMSIAVWCNFVGAAVLSIVVPMLQHAIKYWRLFIVFGILNLFCWVTCYFLVPQTQRRSIDNVFRQQDQSFTGLVKHRWDKLLKKFRIRPQEKVVAEKAVPEARM